ncbi:hypothetical protein V6N13_033447 [Hibiscus sabdariffa]
MIWSGMRVMEGGGDIGGNAERKVFTLTLIFSNCVGWSDVQSKGLDGKVNAMYMNLTKVFSMGSLSALRDGGTWVEPGSGF